MPVHIETENKNLSTTDCVLQSCIHIFNKIRILNTWNNITVIVIRKKFVKINLSQFLVMECKTKNLQNRFDFVVKKVCSYMHHFSTEKEKLTS